MQDILIISQSLEIRKDIAKSLETTIHVDTAADLDIGLRMVRKKRYIGVFIDLTLLGNEERMSSYKLLLQPFLQLFPVVQLIVITSEERLRDAVEVVKAGATTYLTDPIDPQELHAVMQSLQEAATAHGDDAALPHAFWQSEALELVRTYSPAMREVLDKVRVVAPTDTTVLLTGETGTGKGVVAKLIHDHSQRRDQPFISVHCGAIPETLIESELFGHEKGAFTGANRRRLGKFEIASDGTIFLDEIGTMPITMQTKLLRVLQDRQFERLGSEEPLATNARVIAATNVDLEKLSNEGNFRSDLFYRLHVFPLHLPPLRERKEDMPLLIEALLQNLNVRYGKHIVNFHFQVFEALQRHRWPGNIRELENLIERAYLMETSTTLTPESFPLELFKGETSGLYVALDTALPLAEVRNQALENIERVYFKGLLEKHQGRIKSTAVAAGLGVRQLHKLLTKYGIRKEEYKIHAGSSEL